MQRRLKYMDIREILRRLCEHHSDRIAKDLKINRCIIQRYRAWAVDENLLTDELPDHESLAARAAERANPATKLI